jgi:hypothetical protein
MVRYKVKADRVDENRAFVARVFDALQDSRPEGLRYASFQAPDGVSFIHVASVNTQDGENPLAKLQPFKDFIADIRDRCDEPPEATELSLVGNYNLVA